MTNGDKIRAMSDEELANSDLANDKWCARRRKGTDCERFENCYECALDWLKQEAET